MTQEENIHQSGSFPAHKVLSKTTGPTRETSLFETPPDVFSYFIPDSLLLFILGNTNKKVHNFCDRFADNADYFYENKH